MWVSYLYNHASTDYAVAITSQADDKEAADISKSHELAAEIRKLYGLQAITEKPSINVIKSMESILSDFVDNEESPVDAVKATRENIH